jgi:hypothetical protein
VGCLYRTGNLILNCLHCYTSKFLQLAQIFWWSVAIQSRDLLSPRRQERQVRKFNFFAAFASLREIFRVLVAAPPHQVLRGGLFLLDPEFSLRFEKDREVRYFIRCNVAGYLVVSCGLVDQNT